MGSTESKKHPAIWKSRFWRGVLVTGVITLAFLVGAYVLRNHHFLADLLFSNFGAGLAALVVVFGVNELLKRQAEERTAEPRRHILNAIRRTLEQAVLETNWQLPEALEPIRTKNLQGMQDLTTRGPLTVGGSNATSGVRPKTSPALRPARSL